MTHLMDLLQRARRVESKDREVKQMSLSLVIALEEVKGSNLTQT